MFDGENSVVTDKAEVGNEILPPGNVVTVAESTEYPCTVDFVPVVLGVENAGTCGVDRVDLGILRVNVVDRVAESTDLDELTP